MEHKETENELRVLTVDELRTYDGLEALSDQEATEIINTLKELSLLAHQLAVA